jgi:hypothetical protein
LGYGVYFIKVNIKETDVKSLSQGRIMQLLDYFRNKMMDSRKRRD